MSQAWMLLETNEEMLLMVVGLSAKLEMFLLQPLGCWGLLCRAEATQAGSIAQMSAASHIDNSAVLQKLKADNIC